MELGKAQSQQTSLDAWYAEPSQEERLKQFFDQDAQPHHHQHGHGQIPGHHPDEVDQFLPGPFPIPGVFVERWDQRVAFGVIINLGRFKFDFIDPDLFCQV